MSILSGEGLQELNTSLEATSSVFDSGQSVEMSGARFERMSLPDKESLDATNMTMGTITSSAYASTTDDGEMSGTQFERMSLSDKESLDATNMTMGTITSSAYASPTDDGDALTVNEERMIERIKVFIEPMTEMFGTYFKPTEIATQLTNLDGDELQKILKDSQCNSERGMHSLLERLVEEEGRSLLEFYKLITCMDGESGLLPMALLSGTGRMCQEEVSEAMKLIVELVEWTNLGKLPLSDLKSIVDKMVEEDLIKKSKKSFENMTGIVEGIDYLFTLVRRSKPDWVFFLWKSLQESRPDLFSPEIKDDNTDFIPPQIDQACSSGPSFPDPILPSQSGSFDSSMQSSQRKTKKDLQKLKVTMKNKPGLDYLIEKGALKPDQITTDEVVSSASKESPWQREAFFSDEEDEDIEETERKVPFVGASSLDVQLSLRKYQVELSESALQGKNTIVCAPTGCGKTRVAVNIIIKHLRKMTGPTRKSNKVCFFARTVPLAVQQFKTIGKKLPSEYKIKLFTGDSEDSSDMHLLLDDLDVVVLTPMILQNHITRGNVGDLSVFSLLIFDECHHTREKEPYNVLMASYVDSKLSKTVRLNLPQVVGLTASFPVEKAKNAMGAANSILQLCANLDAETVSVVKENKAELEKLVPVPNEEFGYLQERDNDESYKKIIGVMDNLEMEALLCADELSDDVIRRIVASCPSDNRKLQKYNNWTVDLWNKAVEMPRSTKETNMAVRLLMIISQYLTKYHFALETHDLVHLQDVTNYLDDCFAENIYDEYQTRGETRLYDYFKELKASLDNLRHEDNPNLRLLVRVIEEKMLKSGPSSRGIIFVRTRAIAEALALWLNRCEKEEIRNLKANIFTGTNAKESQGGMTQTQQNALVEKFREGRVRLLVATSVAEEGMDVPECNLVIKYNHVGNEITTIQTRGRSRKQGGHSVLLAMSQICEKEMINKRRTQLMYEGIEIVRKMDSAEFKKRVEENQIESKEKREIEEMIAEENKRKYKDKEFTMICKLCRKFTIESKNIRVLCQNHRVVVDRNVWNDKIIYVSDPKYLDELQIVGSVRCNTEIEAGKRCRGPLGTMVFYCNNYFLALGIKNFTVDEEHRNTPKAVKKWKDLVYPLKELTNDDLKNYIKQTNKTRDDSDIKKKDKTETVPDVKQSRGSITAGVQETGSDASSILTSVGTSTLDSEALNELRERYPPLSSSAGSSALSSYASNSRHHNTQRKEFVTTELDSGVDGDVFSS